jgi:4-hydroxy-3-methylbut-2-enyl diphosphate reductase
VLVVGSTNSSNSNRLREIAAKLNVPAYLVDNAGQIDDAWLEGKSRIGITAGASAPEVLVQEVIDYLAEKGAETMELKGREEKVTFSLPRALQR